MENKINKKLETYVRQFKDDISRRLDTLNVNMVDDEKQLVLSYINNYTTLQLDTVDFMKRKRIASSTSIHDRCTAKKASGDQCTRKKKEDKCFCGTHEKSQPHGIVEIEGNKPTLKKCDVIIKEIKGIFYYIDYNGNVYDTADILSNINNPKIIANYIVNDDVYSIPSLQISNN